MDLPVREKSNHYSQANQCNNVPGWWPKHTKENTSIRLE